MSTRWRLRPHEPERIQALSREAGVPPLIAQLLLNRGIDDPAKAAYFLDCKLTGLHDPETLPGVVEAADRIIRAVRDRRKVVIYGDYDVDGVCGTSLLWGCLRLAGATEVEYYIPHRVEEGYGLNGDALRHLAAEGGASMIVTVDCGISAVREARIARELGVELIITDHHTIGPTLPEADVLVHPRLPGSKYPFGDLCGCGVAFKLAWQICKGFGDGKKASPQLRDYLMHSLGLVSLATVADVVPIEDENRILVRHGLTTLRNKPILGMKALIDVSGIKPDKPLNSGHLGFQLGPRINAAGRLERAKRAVEMLTTDDLTIAQQIASELDQCNTARKDLEHNLVNEAHAMVKAGGETTSRGAIVLGKEGWHPGVIGIVASRIADVYHRPTIVIAFHEDGTGQGSGRSVDGFDLYAALSACADGLTSFGGHRAAAGLKLPRSHFEEFAARFDAHCRDGLTPELREKVLHIDAEVPLGMLTFPIIRQIESLEPFGMGNPNPLFVASDVRLVDEPKLMGDNNRHVRFKFAQGDAIVGAVGWGMADRIKKLTRGTRCSIVFQPQINEWNNRRDVQLVIKDFQLEDVPATVAV